MNNLSTYITEKLRINKDTKISNSLIDNVMQIIGVEDKKIREEISLWISDYSKKLYCYVSDIDYKYRYNEFSFDNISINKVNYKMMERAKQIANQSTIYKCKHEDEPIEKITLSQNDLAVYFNTSWNPVIFEKSTI